MKTIAIIEDDQAIGDLLEEVLQKEGYAVRRAYSGTEAVYLLSQQRPDLALLDLMLPGLSGEEVLPHLEGIPVIVVSAKVGVDDKVKLLLGGAADYLTKPFEPLELVARVESVLRRAGRGNVVLRAFGVELDPAAHTVTRDGRPVHLAPREFELLELLMRNRGLTLYREVLYERLWGDDESFDTRPLDLCIARLRRKLGWKDEIRTVFRVGYRLEKKEDGP